MSKENGVAIHSSTKGMESEDVVDCQTTSCPGQKSAGLSWGNVLSAIVVGLVGILATNISGCLERRSALASKYEEVASDNSKLEHQLQNLKHEKNLSEIDTKSRIERLKEDAAAKDRRIAQLQNDNSELRLNLNDKDIIINGKDILIEQLRKGNTTKEIKDQRAAQSAIQGSPTNMTNVGTLQIKPVVSVHKKFDIVLTLADRKNATAATEAYAAQDFSNAVKKARMVYDRIGSTLESGIGKQFFVHRDFQSSIAPVCRIVAEESFARGDYQSAVTQSWLAVCLEHPRPNPFTLALHSAALTRSSSYSIGFMTTGIHEATMNVPEEQRDAYRVQVFSVLCNLGYLQITYPSRDGTSIGKKIDWTQLLGIKQPFCYKKDGSEDLWSLRWEGFGRYSEYNYTKAFEEGLAVSHKVTP